MCPQVFFPNYFTWDFSENEFWVDFTIKVSILDNCSRAHSGWNQGLFMLVMVLVFLKIEIQEIEVVWCIAVLLEFALQVKFVPLSVTSFRCCLQIVCVCFSVCDPAHPVSVSCRGRCHQLGVGSEPQPGCADQRAPGGRQRRARGDGVSHARGTR